jgi:hypothetical protein
MSLLIEKQSATPENCSCHVWKIVNRPSGDILGSFFTRESARKHRREIGEKQSSQKYERRNAEVKEATSA